MTRRAVRGLVRWVLPPLALGAWGQLVVASGRWPTGDGPHILGIAERLAWQLRHGELGLFGWCLQSLVAPHPPGAYVPAVLTYGVFGIGRHVHLVAGALGVWLCWDGIRRLGGGLVGALWLVATAVVWREAERYGVDLFAAACVTQALGHLAASQRLERRGPAIAWGAWMGAAFMVKYTAPMFLWAPTLLAGWWVLRGRHWRTLGAGFLAFLVVAAPWWVVHGSQVVAYLQSANDPTTVAMDTALHTRPWGSWADVAWYLAAWLDAWGWAGALALVLAGLAPRRRQSPPGAFALPMLALVGGWLILSRQAQRQDRYMLPAVPMAAALAGSSVLGWASLPVALAGIYGCGRVYATFTNVPPERDYGHDIASAGGSWPWPQTAYLPASDDPSHWQLDEALHRLRALQGRDTGTVGLLTANHGGPTVGEVLFRAGMLGYRWSLASPSLLGRSDRLFVTPFATDDWPSRSFDVLLAFMRPPDPKGQSWLDRHGLVLVERWPIRDGYEGHLYRKLESAVSLPAPSRSPR